MSRISTTWDGIVILDTPQGYLECPATYDIEGEEFPAEGNSWGGSRGNEVDVKAELVSAILGGLALDRRSVEKIAKGQIESQESSAAEMYVEAYAAGEAA